MAIIMTYQEIGTLFFILTNISKMQYIMRKLTKEEYLSRAIKVHKGKYKYDEDFMYDGLINEIEVICPIHGKFSINAKRHLRGQGCKICGKLKNLEENKRRNLLAKQSFIPRCIEVHGTNIVFNKTVYIDGKHKVTATCTKHGDFDILPNHLLNGVGCPVCNQSHMEKEVAVYLSRKGILYIYQKHFVWLGRQSLDFYIPRYNIAIECQGIQHFEPREHFGGIEEFKKTVTRDKKKKLLCEENGVTLLYINYKDNVTETLQNILKDETANTQHSEEKDSQKVSKT